MFCSFNYHSICAQSFTLRYLNVDVSSYYVSFKVISKHAAAFVSHSHLLQVKSKQAAIFVFHSHPLLFIGAHDFTLFSLALIFLLTLSDMKGCGFLNKRFFSWLGRIIIGFSSRFFRTTSIKLLKMMIQVTFVWKPKLSFMIHFAFYYLLDKLFFSSLQS